MFTHCSQPAEPSHHKKVLGKLQDFATGLSTCGVYGLVFWSWTEMGESRPFPTTLNWLLPRTRMRSKG